MPCHYQAERACTSAHLQHIEWIKGVSYCRLKEPNERAEVPIRARSHAGNTNQGLCLWEFVFLKVVQNMPARAMLSFRRFPRAAKKHSPICCMLIKLESLRAAVLVLFITWKSSIVKHNFRKIWCLFWELKGCPESLTRVIFSNTVS